jgi:hypothetical protein
VPKLKLQIGSRKPTNNEKTTQFEKMKNPERSRATREAAATASCTPAAAVAAGDHRPPSGMFSRFVAISS